MSSLARYRRAERSPPWRTAALVVGTAATGLLVYRKAQGMARKAMRLEFELDEKVAEYLLLQQQKATVDEQLQEMTESRDKVISRAIRERMRLKRLMRTSNMRLKIKTRRVLRNLDGELATLREQMADMAKKLDRQAIQIIVYWRKAKVFKEDCAKQAIELEGRAMREEDLMARIVALQATTDEQMNACWRSAHELITARATLETQQSTIESMTVDKHTLVTQLAERDATCNAQAVELKEHVVIEGHLNSTITQLRAVLEQREAELKAAAEQSEHDQQSIRDLTTTRDDLMRHLNDKDNICARQAQELEAYARRDEEHTSTIASLSSTVEQQGNELRAAVEEREQHEQTLRSVCGERDQPLTQLVRQAQELESRAITEQDLRGRIVRLTATNEHQVVELERCAKREEELRATIAGLSSTVEQQGVELTAATEDREEHEETIRCVCEQRDQLIAQLRVKDAELRRQVQELESRALPEQDLANWVATLTATNAQQVAELERYANRDEELLTTIEGLSCTVEQQNLELKAAAEDREKHEETIRCVCEQRDQLTAQLARQAVELEGRAMREEDLMGKMEHLTAKAMALEYLTDTGPGTQFQKYFRAMWDMSAEKLNFKIGLDARERECTYKTKKLEEAERKNQQMKVAIDSLTERFRIMEVQCNSLETDTLNLASLESRIAGRLLVSADRYALYKKLVSELQGSHDPTVIDQDIAEKTERQPNELKGLLKEEWAELQECAGYLRAFCHNHHVIDRLANNNLWLRAENEHFKERIRQAELTESFTADGAPSQSPVIPTEREVSPDQIPGLSLQEPPSTITHGSAVFSLVLSPHKDESGCDGSKSQTADDDTSIDSKVPRLMLPSSPSRNNTTTNTITSPTIIETPTTNHKPIVADIRGRLNSVASFFWRPGSALEGQQTQTA